MLLHSPLYLSPDQVKGSSRTSVHFALKAWYSLAYAPASMQYADVAATISKNLQDRALILLGNQSNDQALAATEHCLSTWR